MPIKSTKPFVLVDGSSYLFRAYHALPPLMNSHGKPTGAIYGVINMIKKLLADYEPEHIAIIFDPKGDTFRHKIYDEYKANRTVMPEELSVQIKPLFEVIKAMGLPLVIVDEVEADDVIGTLAVQASQAGMETVISTGDKDMAQLVNSQVTLINTMTGKTLDPAGVEEKFGIPPERIIDYLALMGDKVDNIPGIPNVGPKTAAKWLIEFGTLDNIIANADKIKGKVGENLRNNLQQLELSKELVTIKLDVELPLKIEQLTPANEDQATLIKLFKQLEFKSWLAKMLEHSDVDAAVANKKNYEIVTEQKDLDKWLEKIKKAKLFAFDTETTSLDYINAELVGVSLAINPDEAVYIPCAHDYEDAPQQISRNDLLIQLKPILENPKLEKIGHNLKYDMSVLANYDIHLQGVRFDTMLESYVFDSTANRHDMDTLALKYLGHKTIHFEDIAGKGAKQLTFNQIPLEQAGPYAAEDADITLKLHQLLMPKLEQSEGLNYTFTAIEMPLVPVLSRIERNGVLIDAKALEQQSQSLAKRIDELEQKAQHQAKQTFNLSSPKQLQEILFNNLGLPVLQKTPTGQPSTSESVLQELAHDFELPEIILEYRSLSKLKSTYTDKLPQQINTKTGRVHTSYHQAVTATGRLSSSNPNLQNIPIRSEQGRQIRHAFIATKGYKIIALDYSQIELRIMAQLSQDKNLITAFSNGLDIHSATAAEVFDIPLDKVKSEHRRSAKAINFGLIYGMSAFGLAKQLDIDRKSAQAYVNLYFSRYPGVKHYMDEIRVTAREKGYVETLYGRRLYLPEINSSNKMRQMAAERTAINAPMQGTAADIIKRAMVRVDNWLQESKVDAKMIMQVHDELVFEVANKDVDETKKHVIKAMTDIKKLSVPVTVDVGVGDNWGDAH